ncbi:Por secretion system C-terminal sorting domain-containing protein [Lutibacter oricola]|uniref:Por secretion system C-terminal sorting domain-containing protein n=1 Tax=Lutibacter oricola TaxID=762486 RepID=A0A1H3DCL8_9FLAO|nr:fibronectin type III domain-containing protein [Lutibacter oricola]SDX64155.1 Por secretion system C-terminal sorting domain-containing protein [Lutibacter oricola]
MLKKLLLCFFVFTLNYGFSQTNPWSTSSKNISTALQGKNEISNNFKVFSLNVDQLKIALATSPKRGGYLQKSSTIIEFPNANGEFERFTIFEASTMHPDLQARFPNIRSYAGQGIDNPASTIRFSVSPIGFKSMILTSGRDAVFMEPYSKDLKDYMVYSKKSKTASLNEFECLVKDNVSNKIKSGLTARPNADDGILRTYRLAMSATGEFTQYFGGTKAQALAAINATMTRVNGIFEIDFGVTMNLIANTDDVIYTSANSDPYTSSLNSQLQSTLTSVIGEANYDVGHLVHNGSNNGNAGCIGCVCVDGSKGSGFTSHTVPEGDNFDVDYVAHELGHQFGGNHTWTFNGNEGTNAQVEPGSGSTIMGYAGITGATDVQSHSDPYFHAMTIQQITNYVKTTSCQTNTNTGNNVPTALAGSDYTIPKSTPFILTGDGTDADGDNLTYVWEQMDENNASSTYPSTTATTGVAFRSFSPSTEKTRTFPQLSTVLAGNTSTQWETVPSVGRSLNFRLTVRDNVAGGGTNNSDDMVVTVNSSAGPFVVSAPNSSLTWNVGQLQTVTWDVAGTNGSAVNCQTVNVLLSTDGGNTFPISLAAGVANDGSQQITVPNNIGTQNRIKVEAADNIFFDISNTNFAIEEEVICNATVPTNLASSNVGATGATLSWSAVSGATYVLQYRETGTSTWTQESTGSTSFDITGLNTLTQYEAQVQSVCSSGSSVFSSSVNFTTLEQVLTYCTSKGNNVSDEYIGRVEIGTIDNSSGSGNGYSDHTSISTNLNKDEAVTITVTPTWTGTIYSEGYSVWIDYNKDGDFNDSGEQVWTQAATRNTPVSGTFTVPSSANAGATTMRVSMKYNGIPSSCETFTYGEVEDYTVVIMESGPDTEAPTAPSLTSNDITETTVDLSWSGSTDNVGVTGYDVYRDGTLITSTSNTTYQATGLTAGTTYNFTVRAKDAAGNISADSNTETITTDAPDTQAPTAPSLIASNITQNSVDLSWSGSIDNVGVTGYDIYRDGTLIASTTNTTYQATGLVAGTTYNFTVRAKDAAGNISADSNTETITTDAPDTQAPTAPSLIASNITQNSVDLSWSGSTDNVGVTEYDVYQNGILVISTSNTTYQANGLTAGTTYNFTVRAKDAAGNISGDSNTETVTTEAPDSQAPTAPSLIANNETSNSIDLSWSGATDNVGVTGYDVYQDGSLLTSTTSTTYQVTGLAANTTYSFTVRAKDAEGNTSADSNTATATTLEGATNSTTILHQGYFESGWDGWADGGSDVARYGGSRSYEGTYSIRIRDNSGAASAMTLSNVDVSPYDSVEINFYFYARSMESGEDFWVRYYNGSSWTTVAAYARGTDFNNNSFYSATVTLNKANYNFASNARFRFQCDASGNSDYIYIDQVTISGIIGTGSSRGLDGTQYIKSLNDIAESEFDIDEFTVYPNPVKGEFLTIRMSYNSEATYSLTNLLGQTIKTGNVSETVNVGNLKPGIYIIEVNDGEEIMSKKFIKQ